MRVDNNKDWSSMKLFIDKQEKYTNYRRQGGLHKYSAIRLFAQKIIFFRG